MPLMWPEKQIRKTHFKLKNKIKTFCSKSSGAEAPLRDIVRRFSQYKRAGTGVREESEGSVSVVLSLMFPDRENQ